jgi:hypothetical protein
VKLTPDGMARTLGLATQMQLLNADGEVITTHDFRVNDAGRGLLADCESSKARGPVASCQLVAGDGVVIATGTAGLIGSGADVELEHLDVQPGSRVGQSGS